MSQIFETQSIRRSVEQEMSKLANNLQDQETTKNNILASISEQEQEIYLSPEIKQSFLYTIAGFQVAHDERKIWHLYHAIMLVYEIPRIQLILQQKYGKEKIQQLRNQLYNYSKIINQIKIYLDQLDQNTLKNRNNKSTRQRIYRRLNRKHNNTRNNTRNNRNNKSRQRTTKHTQNRNNKSTRGNNTIINQTINIIQND